MLHFFVAHYFDDKITDDGVKALANLPKLESLELCRIKSMTNRVFKHFKTLKRVSFVEITCMQEGIRDLIQKCSNLQEIQLLEYGRDETIEILKSAANALKERTNPISIFSSLSFRYGKDYDDYEDGNFKVRMTPMRSEKNPSTNILFEIFYNKRNLNSNFITYDLNALVKEVSLL